MKSFKIFVEEKTIKTMAVGWGRFNPPHVGHEINFKQIVDLSKKYKADYRLYTTQSEDAKKNPLPYEDKVRFLRKMFPKYARNIILDKNIKTIIQMAEQVYKDGYTRLVLGVGPDQYKTFKDLLTKYNREDGPYYFPDGVKIIDTGKGKRIWSATKSRQAAQDNDLKTFAKGLPKGFKEIEKLFNAVRTGMGLKESVYFRKHIDVKPDKIRDQFFKKEIFNEGDEVLNIKDNSVYTIEKRFSNHVSVISKTDKKIKKFFIHDLTPLNKVS